MSAALLPSPTHHPFAARDYRVARIAIAVRMHLFAAEDPGVGLGPLRVPVVAVGDDERVVLLRIAASGGDLPDAVVAPPRLHDRGLEADMRVQAEVLGVVAEVTVNLSVAGIGGNIFRHGIVPVFHHARVGIDVQ
jgi:hypothetical protein